MEPDPTAVFLESSRFWIQRVFVPILVFIGVGGNVVTIMILTRRRMRCTTNIYLTALAVADLIYLLFVLLLSFEHYPNIHHRKYELYWRFYGITHWICDAASSTSVWLTVSFTMERYIIVCHPLRGKVYCTEGRAKNIITVVALLCLISTASTTFEHQLTLKEHCIQEGCEHTPINQHSLGLVSSNETLKIEEEENRIKRSLDENILENSELVDFGHHTKKRVLEDLNEEILDGLRPEVSYQNYLELPEKFYDGLRFSEQNPQEVSEENSGFVYQQLPERINLEIVDEMNLDLLEQINQIPLDKTNKHTRRKSGFSTEVILDEDDERLLLESSEDFQDLQSEENRYGELEYLTNLDLGPIEEHNLDLDNLSNKAKPNLLSDLFPKMVETQLKNYDFTEKSMDRKKRSKLECTEKESGEENTTMEICDESLPNITNCVRNETCCAKSYTIFTEPTDLGKNVTYTTIFYWFSSITFGLLPLFLIATFNCFLIKAVFESTRTRKGMTSSIESSKQRNENRITILLIGIVILFLMCQTPTASFLIYDALDEASNKDTMNIKRALGNIFNFLLTLNASCNFLMYCVLSKNYRRTFRTVFCARKLNRQDTTATTFSMTRSSRVHHSDQKNGFRRNQSEYRTPRNVETQSLTSVPRSKSLITRPIGKAKSTDLNV